MIDLVQRLREWPHGHKTMIVSEAIDEIERLRPYVEAFRREEARADKLGQELDDLRASIAPSAIPGES